MELSIVAVFILAPLSILAVEENNAMYADAMESYSDPPETEDTHVDKLDDAFLKLMHQKINQHTETLEKLKEMVDANENLSKKILQTLSDNNKLQNTETYGNMQMTDTNRRRTKKNTCADNTSNVKRKMTYGMMLRSVLLTNLSKACRECELERAGNVTTTTKKPTTTTQRRSEEIDFANYVEKK